MSIKPCQRTTKFSLIYYFQLTLLLTAYPDEVIKKMADSKPAIVFERRGDAFYMKFDFGLGMAHDCQFKLGEEFEAKDHIMDPPLFHTKVSTQFRFLSCMQWRSLC